MHQYEQNVTGADWVFLRLSAGITNGFSAGHREGETPLPIPNIDDPRVRGDLHRRWYCPRKAVGE
jgi:hypothetical protein